MWVGRYFPGDDNDTVSWMQHDCYGPRLFDLWSIARKRYLIAEETLGLKTELGAAVKAAKGFDHRTLQYVHDCIAASFRYVDAERLWPDLPGVLSDQPYVQRVVNAWTDYFIAECNAIADRHPAFVRLVLTAAVYRNPDERGIVAEDALAEMLLGKYEYLNYKNLALAVRNRFGHQLHL